MMKKIDIAIGSNVVPHNSPRVITTIPCIKAHVANFDDCAIDFPVIDSQLWKTEIIRTTVTQVLFDDYYGSLAGVRWSM
jgi:hypothetical protein